MWLWGHFEDRNHYPDPECRREKRDPGQMQKKINSLGKFAILIGYEQEKCIKKMHKFAVGNYSCVFISSHYNSIKTCFEGNITLIITGNESRNVRK